MQPSKKLQYNGMVDMRPLNNLHELDHGERNQGWGRRQKWLGPEKNKKGKATEKKTNGAANKQKTKKMVLTYWSTIIISVIYLLALNLMEKRYFPAQKAKKKMVMDHKS